MTRLVFILGALLLASCVRFDVDSSDVNGEQNDNSHAVRISTSDAVVLCPLSAFAESGGGVSIVWAGYPPADDQLQLQHARVSAVGELVQAPQTIAELDAELDALVLNGGAEGIEVQLMQRGESSVVVIEMDEQSTSAEPAELPEDVMPSAQSCQARVQTTAGFLRIFRGQADGELSLFVAADAQ